MPSNKAIIKASGLCLTKYLTESLLEGGEDELYAFVEDNSWQPYEWGTGEWVYGRIEEIAEAIEAGLN